MRRKVKHPTFRFEMRDNGVEVEVDWPVPRTTDEQRKLCQGFAMMLNMLQRGDLKGVVLQAIGDCTKEQRPMAQFLLQLLTQSTPQVERPLVNPFQAFEHD